MKQDKTQRLFVLSGPSGSGKATMLRYVTEHSEIQRVVTFTTRAPRPDEVYGIDYHFISLEEFNALYDRGELIERERVYGDCYYGSPRDIFKGTDGDVIMELDTKGAANYRKLYKNVTTIFILPPTIEELIDRIDKRHPESNFSHRLKSTRPMIESATEYDYLIINDDVERAGEELLRIMGDLPVDSERDNKLRLVDDLLKELRTTYNV
jgi:guanylate kinase